MRLLCKTPGKKLPSRESRYIMLTLTAVIFIFCNSFGLKTYIINGLDMGKFYYPCGDKCLSVFRSVSNANSSVTQNDSKNLKISEFHPVNFKTIDVENFRFKSQSSFFNSLKRGNEIVNVRNEEVNKLNKLLSNKDYFQLPGYEIFLYSAFLDIHVDNVNIIRIFGIQNRTQPRNLSCAIEVDNKLMYLKVEYIRPVYSSWPTNKTIYQAYYYGFHVPRVVVPGIQKSKLHLLQCSISSFSSVTIPYDIVGKQQLQPEIALCLRALWGNVNKLRIIEWIEFNLLLGIHHMTFYSTIKDWEVNRILDFYENKGVLTVKRGSLMDTVESLMKKDPIGAKIRSKEWLMEQLYLVTVNDCLYNYGKSYKYVALIDIDEIIIPHDGQDLKSMLQKILKQEEKFSAYLFPTVWHFDQFGPVSTGLDQFRQVQQLLEPGNRKKSNCPSTKVLDHFSMVNQNQNPSYRILTDDLCSLRSIDGCLHMFSHLKRTPIMHVQPKGIFLSGKFVTANWHSVLTLTDGCGFNGNLLVNGTKYGTLHHYRNGCKHEPEKCQEMLKSVKLDMEVPIYEKVVEKRVENSIEKMCSF